jgi:MtN3 and saliva related transmembrane protein
MEQIIGYTAATLTTISFIPQVIHIIRTKNTESISLSMYILFCIGVSLWLIYGLLQNSYPIVIANTITLFFALIILSYKLKNYIK